MPAATGFAPRLASRPLERRRHARVAVSLLGRFMLPDRREFPCRSITLSVAGALVAAPAVAKVGDQVIIYFEQIGRFEGPVTRLTEEGFAMRMLASARKQDKLADQLTWLANRDQLGLPEDRRHERLQPRQSRIVLTLPDGRQGPVKLLDMSLSGAAFSTELPLMIGDAVILGKTQARVVRKFENGCAVEFRQAFREDEIESIDL